MNYTDLPQDPESIQRRLDEYRAMLEIVKGSNSTESMIPLLELAIEGHEDLLKKSIKQAQFRAKIEQIGVQEIIVRATNLDYKVKDRHCQGTYRPEGDQYVFELDQTRTWFVRHGFPPRAGFLLIPADSQRKYVITEVDFRDKRPKRAIFTAVPVDAA